MLEIQPAASETRASGPALRRPFKKSNVASLSTKSWEGNAHQLNQEKL